MAARMDRPHYIESVGIRSRIRQYSLGTVPDRLFVDHFSRVDTVRIYTRQNFLKETAYPY